MSVSVSKRKIVALHLFSFFSCYCFSQEIILSGKTINIENSAPVSVEIQAFSNKQKVKSVISNIDGDFELSLPIQGITHVSVLSKSFRELKLPFFSEASENQIFYFVLPLISKSREGIDVPYEQSEQSQVSLERSKIQNGKSKRIFRLFDALTRSEISGKVCLFYTKSGIMKCFDEKTVNKEVTFNEEDIIAIEVESEGYQNFQGNLITKMDEKDSYMDIYLLKHPIIFSFLSTLTAPSLKDPNLEKVEIGIKKDIYYGVATTQGEYTFSFQRNQVKKKLSNGINLLNFNYLNTNNSLQNTLYFDQSNYQLSSENKKLLNDWSIFLNANTHLKVKISGHTDDVGLSHLNQTLSTYRVKSVINYLVIKGVNLNQIVSISHGDKKPAVTNDTEENRQKNRRVDIEVI